MKYIIFNKKIPVIFHEVINHNDISAGIYAGKPTSAGFVTLVPIEQRHEGYINATVYGESISLDLKSNGVEDEKLIENLINNLY